MPRLSATDQLHSDEIIHRKTNLMFRASDYFPAQTQFIHGNVNESPQDCSNRSPFRVPLVRVRLIQIYRTLTLFPRGYSRTSIAFFDAILLKNVGD
jgi:hypothetical protein